MPLTRPPPNAGRLIILVLVIPLVASSFGLPVAAAESAPCPSIIAAGARTPPRPTTTGLITTMEVEEQPDLAFAQDSAIFPAPTVQTVPTLLRGNRVQVVLSLDVVSYSALEVTWGLSRISAVNPLDTRILECEPVLGASGHMSLPAPSQVGDATLPGRSSLLVTYVLEGPFLGLHLSVTEQGAGVVGWSVVLIPLTTVCPTLVDPTCPIN